MKLSYGDSVITMDITDDKVSTLVIEDKRLKWTPLSRPFFANI